MDEPFETLLTAAVRAPSGDNCQPWRFVIDPDVLRISLYVDETCDPSPMNASQCMSRVAVGAALENLLRAAKAKGWSVRIETPTDSAAAVVRVTDFHPSNATTVGVAVELPPQRDPTIFARVTNRRRYDGRPVPSEVIDRLQRATPEIEGIRVLWIHDRPRLDSLAIVVGRSDALMLSEPTMRKAFLANVRFDLPANAGADEYLPLGSLELPFANRTAFRFLPHVPDWVLRMGWAKRKFAAAARRLVQSASGLCAIVTANDSPKNDLMIGRSLQRAWLALTTSGLVAQPMMSVAIMENILRHGSKELLQSVGRAQAQDVVTEFRRLVPEAGKDRLAFTMRFGHAKGPTCRTGRLPLEARTVHSQPASGSTRPALPNLTCEANSHELSSSI
jgi:hypothetical protein